MRLKFTFPLKHPFHPDWVVTPVRVARGHCTVLSGNIWELLEGAQSGVSAKQAVLVMLYSDTPALSDSDRDRLWEAYQVPVLACLLDEEGRLVGWECEAQDGLHVGKVCLSDARKLVVFSDDSVLGFRVPINRAIVETSPCDCGRPGERLRFKEAAPTRRLEVVTSGAAAGKGA
jgi:hypothetical protein